MKLLFDKDELNKLFRLVEEKEINIGISEQLNEFLMNNARDISKKMIDKYTKVGKSEEEAYYLSFLDVQDIDIDEDGPLFDHYFKPIFIKDYISNYVNNPYLQNIKIIDKKIKDVNLINDSYYPYEAFPYNDVEVNKDEYYHESLKIAFFDRKFFFPSLEQNNVTWMSVIPNEINTMKEAINNASGKVLVYGLGLGYFTYMVSIKDDVNKVVVIEKDPKIIEIFKKEILPQFNHPEKIEIIECDAFKYEETSKERYDYVFVDLYHGSEDGLFIYKKFKKLENLSNKYVYWLEQSILAYFRRIVITFFEEHIPYYEAMSYQESEDELDQLFYELYMHYRNMVFDKYYQIEKEISDESLISLIESL